MYKPILIIAMLIITALAHAGVPEAGDEVNAKIARIKSTHAAAGEIKDANESGGAEDATRKNLLDSGCNIAIGNIFEDGKGSVTALAKRETTVVVTGDIVQAGNKCQ